MGWPRDSSRIVIAATASTGAARTSAAAARTRSSRRFRREVRYAGPLTGGRAYPSGDSDGSAVARGVGRAADHYSAVAAPAVDAHRHAEGAAADGRSLHGAPVPGDASLDRKSTRLNSSHVAISYAGFCLKKKTLP